MHPPLSASTHTLTLQSSIRFKDARYLAFRRFFEPQLMNR
jgi:hypothetical protein